VITYLNTLETDKSFLVGHSYSGFVASLTAEQVPEKVKGLIFVEVFYLKISNHCLKWQG